MLRGLRCRLMVGTQLSENGGVCEGMMMGLLFWICGATCLVKELATGLIIDFAPKCVPTPNCRPCIASRKAEILMTLSHQLSTSELYSYSNT